MFNFDSYLHATRGNSWKSQDDDFDSTEEEKANDMEGNPDSSTPYSELLLSPEMEAALDDYAVGEFPPFHLFVLDKSGTRTTPFLKLLMEDDKAHFYGGNFLYIDLASIKSTPHLFKIFSSGVLWAVSSDAERMSNKIDEQLPDHPRKYSSCYDEDGIEHQLFDIPFKDNAEYVINGLDQLVDESLDKGASMPSIYLDHAEIIETLPDSEDMISFIGSHVLYPEKPLYRVVIASSSQKVNDLLCSKLEPGDFHTVDITPLLKEPVKEIVGNYFNIECADDSEECLNRIYDLCGDNLEACVELAVLTKRLSNGHPDLEAINQAFNHLVESRNSQYLRQTNRLILEAQQFLKIMALGWPLRELMLFDKNKEEKDQVFIPLKDALVKSGILIERDAEVHFADPIYQHWMKSYRYPIIGYKKKERDSPTVSLIYPTRPENARTLC